MREGGEVGEVGGVKGFLGDLMRAVWGLGWWNARKSWYRWKGAKGVPPCQHPSDLGVAGATGCEAVLGWSRPERFKRVCPLLQQGEGGRWVCGVKAEEVRPFWGRVGGLAVLIVVLGGGVVAGMIYTGLRAVGYPVTWRQVVWPPAWKEAREVRAEFFFRQGLGFLAEGNVKAAILPLQVSFEMAPDNFEAGVLLAQLRQAENPAMAESIYRQLAAVRPDRRGDAMQLWLRHLLVHRAWEAVARLALDELTGNAEEVEKGVWLHALFFAVERGAGREFLRGLGEQRPGWLEGEWAAVWEAEGAVGVGAGATLRWRILAEEAREPFVQRHALSRLMHLGAAAEAAEVLAFLQGESNRLSGREAFALGLEAFVRSGREAERVRVVELRFAGGGRVSEAEWRVLAKELIARPGAELARVMALRWREESRMEGEAEVGLRLALYCGAARAGETGWAEQLSAGLVGGGQSYYLAQLAGSLRRDPGGVGTSRLLTYLPPLPLDSLYALLALGI